MPCFRSWKPKSGSCCRVRCAGSCASCQSRQRPHLYSGPYGHGFCARLLRCDRALRHVARRSHRSCCAGDDDGGGVCDRGREGLRQSETSEIDILQLIGLDGTTSLVALDIDAARRKIAHLPWVESVEVRKVYPKTIEVKLKERQAYAIWQHGQELSLIEKSGSVIAPLRDNKFSRCRSFVGRDAETAAASLDDAFSKWPDVKARVKAYVWISGRRWDLHMDNGVVVKLPEDDVDQALATLSKFDKEQAAAGARHRRRRSRLSDSTAIQLTPEAAVRRRRL
jgi:cell division septal protein FtsQ